jgi:hypothetical protein
MTVHVIFLALGIFLFTPAYAWAYVDPGTGSYLFQLAVAGFLAGAYTVRRYWDVLKTKVRGAFRREDGTDASRHGG